MIIQLLMTTLLDLSIGHVGPGPAEAQSKNDKKTGLITQGVIIGIPSSGWSGMVDSSHAGWSAWLVLNSRVKVPIVNPKVRVTFSYANTNFRLVRDLSPKRLLGPGAVTEDMLLPGHNSRWSTIGTSVDTQYWRRDVNTNTVFLSAEPYKYGSNLRDPQQLLAFIFMEPKAKVLAAFDKDPSLLKVKTKTGLTPVLMSVLQSDVSLVKALEKRGGSLFDKGITGETALHFSALSTPEMIKYIASRGVKHSLTTQIKWNEYDFAVEMGNSNAIGAFARLGISPNLPDATGRTALHYAILDYDEDVIRALKRAGASFDVFDRDGSGAMGMAVTRKNTKMAELILKLGGNVNQKDPKTGRTPLHLAVIFNCMGPAEWLVRHGAKVKVKDLSGKTPKDYAGQKTHPGDREVWTDWLVRAEKDRNAKLITWR